MAEIAGGIFGLGRTEFEQTCVVEAGDRSGFARIWGDAGVDIRVGDDSDVSPCLRRDGYWEAEVTLGLARVVKPGMSCWNIGANLGYFAALLGLLAGPDGSVVAFEPQQKLFKMLCETLDANPSLHNVLPVNAAVGRYERTASLHLDQTKLDCRGGVSLLSSSGTAVVAEKVPVKPLDGVVEFYSFEHSPDFIMCDAEGAEEEIFLGSALVAEKRPILCIEWAPYRYLCPRSLAAFLRECGYVAYKFVEGGLANFDIEKSIIASTWEQVLFLPEGPAPRRRMHDDDFQGAG